MTVPPINGILIADPSTPGGVRYLSPAEVAAQLRAMVGRRLAGGCDDCAATHEYVEDVEDVFDILIHHNETCPTLGA